MSVDQYRMTSVVEIYNRENFASTDRLSVIENAGKMAISPEQFTVLVKAEPNKIQHTGRSDLLSNMRLPFGPNMKKNRQKRKKKK